MRISKAVFGLIVLSAASVTSAELINSGTYGGKVYPYQDTALNYLSAKQETLDLGGYLVAADNDWLVSVLTPMQNNPPLVAWTGLTNPDNGREWLSGESAIYAHWSPAGVSPFWAKPACEDTGGISPNCGYGVPFGFWGDKRHRWGRCPDIHEKVPEPATIALLAFGVLGLLRRKRV